MEYRTPSEVVGAQVRAIRKRRGWKQEKLAARLEELGAPGWRQSKITKIERGQMKRLPLEDVFELAAALDVAPIYLLAPASVPDEEGEPLIPGKVLITPKVGRFPQQIRPWVDGTRPLLSLGDYKSNEEASAGARFFFFEGRPFGEWQFPDTNPEVAKLVRETREGEADAE